MGALIDTTEMYLKTVWELEEENIPPLRARIAERLGHSGPTVSQTVARMERDGLIFVGGDRQLAFTEEGRLLAMRVMRKHRLAERLLIDIIGLDWVLAHSEACRWEHVMSLDVERRLAAVLDHPHHDPYGNPIPGLAELGDTGAVEAYMDGVVSLSDWAGSRAVLARVGEPVQVDTELLARMVEVGLRPGQPMTIEHRPHMVTVAGVGSTEVLDIPEELARHLYVRSV